MLSRIKCFKTFYLTSAVLLRRLDYNPNQVTHPKIKSYSCCLLENSTDVRLLTKNAKQIQNVLQKQNIHYKSKNHQNSGSKKKLSTNPLNFMVVLVGASVGVRKKDDDDEILEK